MNNVVPMKPDQQATRWSMPSLPENVAALLKGEDSPIVGPKTAKILSDWIAAQPTLDLATEEKVDSMIARLALATKEKPLTPAANEERLDVYFRALRRCALVDLFAAFDELIITLKWMPTPAEIYQAAARNRAKREWPVERAKHLVWLHERSYEPPVPLEDRPTPDEVRDILSGASCRFPSSRGKS